MTIGDWLTTARKQLANVGIQSDSLDAQLLVEYVLGKPRQYLPAYRDEELSKEQFATLSHLLSRRLKREPLAYLVHKRHFFDHIFYVDKNVLIPRPETEALVQKAIETAPKNAKVLEIGTGSGAITIAMATHRPDCHYTATDISKTALTIAQKNAKHVPQVTINWLQSDLFSNVQGKFNVVLANLPYVPTPARRQPEITFEPDLALYAGDDGLDIYRQFFSVIRDYCTDNALILIEFSPTQYKAVRELWPNTTPITEYIYQLSLS